MAKKKQTTLTYTSGSGYKVRLRGKRLNDGKISLYLDYYSGYSIEDGKPKASRANEFLKMYLIGTPQTQEEREKNTEILRTARAIRDRREEDVIASQTGTMARYKRNVSFFDYCDQYMSDYKKSDRGVMQSTVDNFREYRAGKDITLKDVRPDLVVGFRDFLIKKYQYGTPLALFTRFKKILKRATKEGYFRIDPAADVSLKDLRTDADAIRKEILTFQEIELLKAAICKSEEVKRAFLFCIYTGLRFSDVKSLRWDEVKDGMIRKRQTKTGGEVIIPLSKNATEQITGTHGSGVVFRLFTGVHCNARLQEWVTAAGIKKHITWHCARHTFGTLLISKNCNIRTVQELMGHKTLSMTQRYTRISDSLKTDAVNLL